MPISTIETQQLETVTGGNIATGIAGLIDKFAGTGGKATQIAQGISGLIEKFKGGGGSSGGGGASGGE